MCLPSTGCADDIFVGVVTVSVCNEEIFVEVGDKNVSTAAVDVVLNADVDATNITTHTVSYCKYATEINFSSSHDELS